MAARQSVTGIEAGGGVKSVKATIGENIKKARNKLGLTQDDLVRKSDVKYTTLTKIGSDVVVRPSVQTVAKIAKALDVPMEDLVK